MRLRPKPKLRPSTLVAPSAIPSSPPSSLRFLAQALTFSPFYPSARPRRPSARLRRTRHSGSWAFELPLKICTATYFLYTLGHISMQFLLIIRQHRPRRPAVVAVLDPGQNAYLFRGHNFSLFSRFSELPDGLYSNPTLSLFSVNFLFLDSSK